MGELDEMFRSIFRMSKRALLSSVLAFGLVISTALALWKGLGIVSGSDAPIVVVLSGSMEPVLSRGDMLFLSLSDPSNATNPLKVGDIVVYKSKSRPIPIIHRVLEEHMVTTNVRNRGGSSVKIGEDRIVYLTKGDHNPADDRGLYGEGIKWLEPEDVMGRAVFRAPYLGMITIWMNDYPYLKYIMIATLAFFVLVNRE